MRKIAPHIIVACLLTAVTINSRAQDSSRVLKKVTVSGLKKKNPFTTEQPTQALSHETLQQLNAPSVGDAARFFSGVQVKDYGGVGGLKTISVRSLGANHTGILYDGVPVSDVQSGQIDLSRYSSTFLQSIELYQANPSAILLPARAFAAASILGIHTPLYNPALIGGNSWQAGVRNGSFGYWSGFGGASWLLPRNMALNVFAEGVTSKGDYPFTVQNGNLSEKTKRNNSDLRSLQGEVNLGKLFKDSSTLQFKAGSYDSKRGLPGAVIFYNDRAVQKLYDHDYFAQLRYVNQLTATTSLLVTGKYSHAYTRYVDPDFLNNTGGLDDKYRQNEGYASVAVSQSIGRYFSAAIATDATYTTLSANITNFATPSRFSNWDNALVAFNDSLWQAQASLLWSYFSDKAKLGTATGDKNKLTPTVAVSRKLSAHSPFMIRLFYKQVYRMPTFNDLYYNFFGNTNLRPELARQYNAGIVYTKQVNSRALKQFNLSIDGYINRIDDKIIAVPAQNLFSWTMLNLGKVDIKGVDVTGEGSGWISHTISWMARIAYTYQQALDITDPTSSKYKNRIPYTPDNSGSGLLSLGYGYWNAGYSLVFSGTRYVLGENNPYNQLDGWGTHDAFVTHSLSWRETKCTIKAEVNNITNEQYDVIRYYPMPGRSYKISLLINH